MKSLRSFGLSLLERFAAFAMLILLLPTLFVIGLLIYWAGGGPVIVADELRTVEGEVASRFRFRTAGRGISSYFPHIGRFLRAYSIDEFPGLWSVARGDVKMRDFLRFR